MRRTLIFMVLGALLYAVPAKAQDQTALTLALANKQLTADKADLQSKVANLEIRLEMAQARIAELEKATAKPAPAPASRRHGFQPDHVSDSSQPRTREQSAYPERADAFDCFHNSAGASSATTASRHLHDSARR